MAEKLVRFLCKLTASQREWLREEGYRTRSDSTKVLRKLVARAMKKTK